MGEFFFVLKSLIITTVILMLMQVRVGGVSVETQAHNWIQTSSLSKQLEKVAAGAILAVKNATKALAEVSSQALSSGDDQRASRFDFEIKRGPNGSSQKHQDKQQDKSQDKGAYLAP